MENKNLVIITKDNYQEVMASDKLVLVDFWAEWCGPCKMLLPIIGELANDYADKAVIAKINVDECQDLAESFGVVSIPTIVLIKDGKEIERSVGFRQKSQLAQLIDKNLK